MGHLVPQKEVHPPKDVEVGGNMTTEQMVEAGKAIVAGKGTCLSCHTTSARFPTFDGMGQTAGKRKEGMSDVDYLAESLYEPGAFIVPSFAGGMPPVNKPPIGLNDQEILTVIAYLQSLGGTPTVTMDTKLKYQGAAPAQAASATPASGGGAEENLTGEQLVAKFGCMGCHSLTTPDRMLGPSLFDVGARMNHGQIYEAILDPDATIAAGDPPYPPGVMGATLQGGGFYEKLSSKQLKEIVNYLLMQKGGK